jgi:hypothetical protein
MKTFTHILLLLAVLLLIVSPEAWSQVSISTDGSVPDSSAMLEIKSNNQGLLLPRIDYNNRPLTPPAGLMIYFMANAPFGNGLYISDGGGWLKINTTTIYMGQHTAGGVIFYIDSTGHHRLISSESDLPGFYPYGCDTISMVGATATAFGTGELNTAAIVAACPSQDVAARVCDTSTHGGFTDWFLPSRDELDSMYVHQATIGGFNSSFYWSSSEVSDPGAWIVDFNAVYPWINAWTSKFSSVYVRCIRKF